MHVKWGRGGDGGGYRERECKSVGVGGSSLKLFIGIRILHSIQKIERTNMPELLGCIPVSIV